MSSKAKMADHLQTHKTDRPKDSICDICGKGFFDSIHLGVHRKRHEVSQQNYSCNVCLKTYSKICSYKKHLKTHNDQKYTCEVCDREFKTNSNWNRHMRIHENKEPQSARLSTKFLHMWKS